MNHHVRNGGNFWEEHEGIAVLACGHLIHRSCLTGVAEDHRCRPRGSCEVCEMGGRTPAPRPSSEATVTTDAAGDYGRRLIGSLGRGYDADWDTTWGSVDFVPALDGTVEVWARPGVLHLRVTAGNPETLSRLEYLVASRLILLAGEDVLTVHWI